MQQPRLPVSLFFGANRARNAQPEVVHYQGTDEIPTLPANVLFQDLPGLSPQTSAPQTSVETNVTPWNPMNYIPAVFEQFWLQIPQERPAEEVFHRPPYLWDTGVRAQHGIARPAELDVLIGGPDYVWTIGANGNWSAALTQEARHRYEAREALRRTLSLVPLMQRAIEEVRDTFPLPAESELDLAAALSLLESQSAQSRKSPPSQTTIVDEKEDLPNRSKEDCCICLQEAASNCKLEPCGHCCLCSECAQRLLQDCEAIPVSLESGFDSPAEVWLTPCPLCRGPCNSIQRFARQDTECAQHP